MIRIIPRTNEFTLFGTYCKNKDNIQLVKKEFDNAEAYSLEITDDAVIISAGNDKGFFYGKMTLRQIETQCGENLPKLIIRDKPKYEHRGFMLDSARHFIPVKQLKKMIDLAAMLKFNKFHWHLSDDQGFRIQLDSFPELSELGSVRSCDSFGSLCRSSSPHSGCYSKEDIKEIIRFCSERFIDVIPEIDMPGHTSAILHVFPELSCRMQAVEIKTRQGIFKDNLCIGKSETFNFITVLLDELCEMFPYEYFHIGGDEAPDDYRRNCPHCRKALNVNGLSSFSQLQCLFAGKISDYLKSKGKKAIVWNDILKGGNLDPDITVQRWMDPEGKAIKAANEGRKTIISDFRPYYFDYPYGMYPLKEVYMHNPQGHKKLTDEGKKNIKGIETPLWTEFVNSSERMEYLCIPRWLAFSENAWAEQKGKNYKSFLEGAEILCDYLKKQGYKCAELNNADMPLIKRGEDTAKFFKAFLSK